MSFIYDKNSWKTVEQGEEGCWLLTNGLGSYSSLSTIGSNARNDHALLMASVLPPVNRMHMVTNVKCKLTEGEKEYDLTSGRKLARKGYDGFHYLEEFSFEDYPVWTYKAGDTQVKILTVMKQKENTVVLKYEINSQTEGTLELTPCYQFVPKGEQLKEEQKFATDEEKVTSRGLNLYYWTNGENQIFSPVYEENWYYAKDFCDGRDYEGRTVSTHKISCRYTPGQNVFYLVFTMEKGTRKGEEWAENTIEEEKIRRQNLEKTAGFKNPFASMLAKSADQFLAYRESVESETIIAGYPFFGDWGRDTLIALTGCMLSTRQYEKAKNILKTFAKYCKKGLLPNMFPEDGKEPLYNTVDAALWFVETLYLYGKRTGDWELSQELFPVLEEIMEFYEKGTDYGIKEDEDGLLMAGEGLAQVTWMDVRVEDYLPTPRHGKPVEINALWYNALKIMEQLYWRKGMPREAEGYAKKAELTRKSFLEKFWMEEKGYFKDVLSGTEADEQLRCNQVWTLTLSYCMPEEEQAEGMLQVLEKDLYTPWGMRSLSPEDPQYHPYYGGPQGIRDLAYHQGTVWAFPLGAYYRGILRFWKDKDAAKQKVKRQLKDIEACMREGCVGQIAEIYDGDVPSVSRGCFAQAWSVGEILRVYEALERETDWMEEKTSWFDLEEFRRDMTYPEGNLGSWIEDGKTNFRLWTPVAERVQLVFFENGEPDSKETKRLDLEKKSHGIWEISVEGELDKTYYVYELTIGTRTVFSQDPYGKACGVNGKKTMVVNLKNTDPEGWKEDSLKGENKKYPIIYELHIRDFSSDPQCGVEKKLQGKYLAFTSDDTALEGEEKISTCISYLKKLGVTYVHLLPTYDYGSVDESKESDENYNWGYDPVNYNIPEGSYSTDAHHGEVRIREFKEMVMALHKAGIGVIMDVVYNHFYNLEHPLQLTVPDYFVRKTKDGSYANGSGCGNDTASEREMYRRYMKDSVKYWAEEYHIDGFRFDLMALHDVQTMNEIRKTLDEIKDRDFLMYGEPWAAGETNMREGSIPANMENVHLLDKEIAVFSDRIRDGVKGSVFLEHAHGYVNGDASEREKCVGKISAAVCGKSDSFATAGPSQLIQYVSAHDDWTLWDKLCLGKEEKPDYGKKDPVILQENKMAAGIVFTCLGKVFFQAGEEFGRTKYGCSNSYNQPASLNKMDWKRREEFTDLVEYYQFLIQFRKSVPFFARTEKEAAENIQFVEKSSSRIEFEIKDENGTWKKLHICYHGKEEKEKLELEEEGWYLLSDGVSFHCLEGKKLEKMSVDMEPGTVVILGKKEV